jgi:hypothetical protein
VYTLEFPTIENGQLQLGLQGFAEAANGLGIAPNETSLDLLILGAVVYVADTKIARRVAAQDGWSREISITLEVTQPDDWAGHSHEISALLHFLTGDFWNIQFQRSRARPRLASSMVQGISGPVALLSGGADSLVGASNCAMANVTPIFASHYWDTGTRSHQIAVRNALQERYGIPESRFVSGRIGLEKRGFDGLAGDNTQRSRSFLFLAMATFLASSIESEILIPENGLISLNIPTDPLRLGAFSTRTTHPHLLERWNLLLREVGLRASVRNPYSFMTKGEMLRNALDRTWIREAFPTTISCSSPSKLRWTGQSPRHCGTCVPCIIRRAAGDAAYGQDPTEYACGPVGQLTVSTNTSRGEHFRSFKYAIQRLEALTDKVTLLVQSAGPLAATQVDSYARVYREGLREVADSLEGLTVSP